MPYLAAAVVLLGALTVLNLLLTVTIIRRLRDQPQHDHDRDEAAALPFSLLETGTPVPAVQAADLAGRPVDFTGGTTVVGFFSGSCQSCRAHVEPFLAYVRGRAVTDAVAVVSGDAAEGADLVAALREHVRVVAEPADGRLAAAFKVGVFPTFYLVGPDATVAAGHTSIRALPAPVAA
ncbi:TlpA family protein disulfide reductase [Actinomadura macrotermitis]|uniref:Thioredoxin domain-containing protein n=1 Tax=Actinomadura macrotermitis TaxID=2585200 RepID=A0A7K0C4P4_9ACTN|nr:hypothetical protein [Actinomadura macrotermitis]MQY08405.1 hypothetical protein [Actinomadura macrotermitis]